MKKHILVFTWLALSFLLASGWSLADSVEEHLKIVSFKLQSQNQTVFSDEFFEVIDMGDYILAPLNVLYWHLGFDINFDEKTNQIMVTSSDENRHVTIDLNNEVYVVGNQITWAGEPPIDFEDDAFVSLHFFEYLESLTVTWDNEDRELAFDGFDQERTQRQKPAWSEDADPITGPNYSFGPVQYRLSVEHEMDSAEGETELRSLVDVSGRAGDWGLSLTADVNALSSGEDIKASLPSIVAKYNENDTLVILGDYSVHLDSTVNRKNMRGALYLNPDYQTTVRYTSYTTISGPAKASDKASLYVNDRFLKTVVVQEDNEYTFTNVPLKPNRVNVVRVLIAEPDGSTREVTQKIAASPRTMDKGEQEMLAAYGAYRDPYETDWEGKLAGVRGRFGLAKDLFLQLEAARLQPETVSPDASYGADVGLSYRLGSLIAAVDWLGGGTETAGVSDLGQGGETSLMYCLEKGYLKGTAFYIEPEATQGVDRNPGKGARAAAAWDFTSNSGFEGMAERKLAIPGMTEELEWTHGEGSLWHRWGSRREHYTKITSGATWDLEDNSKELSLYNRTSLPGFSGKYQLDVSKTDHWDEDPMVPREAFALKLDTIKSFSRAFLIGSSLDFSGDWEDKLYLGTDLDAQLDAKWRLGRTWITGSGGLAAWGYAADSDLLEYQYGFGIGRQFTDDFTGQATVKERHLVDEGYSYTTAEIGGEYWWDNSSVAAEVQYVSPVETRVDPQWSASLAYSIYFKSGLGLTLAAERIYDDIWQEEPEDIVRISLTQALAFGNNGIRGFRYNGSGLSSYVAGVVYLDENANGHFDPHEQPLSGVTVSLDGWKVQTDDSGQYAFDRLRPGIYTLSLNPGELPEGYSGSDYHQLIKVRENEGLDLDFGLEL